MVESPQQGEGFWPSIYGPLKQAGRRLAEYFSPSADASANEEAYEINVELPGVPADAVEVSVHDGALMVKAR